MRRGRLVFLFGQRRENLDNNGSRGEGGTPPGRRPISKILRFFDLLVVHLFRWPPYLLYRPALLLGQDAEKTLELGQGETGGVRLPTKTAFCNIYMCAALSNIWVIFWQVCAEYDRGRGRWLEHGEAGALHVF